MFVFTSQKPTGSQRISTIVFGDPHIISFDGENILFSTCSKEGMVTYMKNTFVIIKGVNTAVTGFQGNLPPTFMTEVSCLHFVLAVNVAHAKVSDANIK